MVHSPLAFSDGPGNPSDGRAKLRSNAGRASRGPRLEAAEDFPDDLGQPLFPKVKLMRAPAHDDGLEEPV